MAPESHRNARRRRGFYLTGVAFGVAAALSAAHAQQDTSAAAKNDTDLAEIVVTANKREEKLQDVGSGISVVTDKVLDQLAANSLADYLQEIPGVNLQSLGAPGYGNVEIRGISPQSIGGTVSTYIDNIPVGGSSSIGESHNFVPDLDPADIQNVEVLKGPQGTLYGATSLGGVIKYVTKQPSLTTPEANITEEFEHVQYGDYGGKIRASGSTPVTDDLAIRVSGYYRWIPGFIDDLGVSGKDANNGYDWGLRGTALWKPTSDFSVNLNAMEQWSRQNALSAVDLSSTTFQPLYGDLSQLRYTPERFIYQTRLYSAEIKYDQPYGSFLSASSFNSIRPIETGDDTLFFPPIPGISPTPGPDAPVGFVGHHEDAQETEELRFTSNRLGNVEFLTGLFFQHEHISDGTNYLLYEQGGLVPNPSVPQVEQYDRGGTLNEYAGFFDVTYYVLPNLDATFGYRYSAIKQNEDQFFGGPLYEFYGLAGYNDLSTSQTSHTYLGNIRWHITDNTLFYLRAASGYRPGGARPTIPGAPPDFALHYDSDSIWSYEAGTKVTALDGRLTVDADLFWINWNNIQELIEIGHNTTDGNGGHALSRGVELLATYVPITGLSLRGNIAYTDAFFKDAGGELATPTVPGQRLSYVPELKGTLSADYSWPVWNYQANVGGDWSYTGNQYDNNGFPNVLLPSFSVFNARAGVKWDNYTFNFYVKNVADKRAIVGDGGYLPPIYGIYPFTVFVNQPRTVGVQFSQHF
jgi:iron complex outermembrane recepter protein